METKAKFIISLLLVLLIACKDNTIENRYKKVDQVSTNICKLKNLKYNLYRDCEENLCVILKNTAPYHPSQMGRRKSHDTLKVVFDFKSDSIIYLNTIIDTNTYYKFEGTTNYYADKNFLYSHPYMVLPGYRPFQLIDSIQNVHFFENKDSVKTKFGIFYKGVIER